MSTTISQSLLPEFDAEMANTRKTLERVPEGNPDFRPHPKSMTLARLAGHVAEIPAWATVALTLDEFDTGAPGARQAFVMTSRDEAVARFDGELTRARAALIAATDADLMKTWSVKRGGVTVMALPKVAVLRGFVLNHMIHHRAQLGVYLRMNDVPVPSIYGPSADEGNM